MNILVLDIGTTSMRGILYDQDGNELCQVSRLTPLIFIDNYSEQDPLVHRADVQEALLEGGVAVLAEDHFQGELFHARHGDAVHEGGVALAAEVDGLSGRGPEDLRLAEEVAQGREVVGGPGDRAGHGGLGGAAERREDG